MSLENFQTFHPCFFIESIRISGASVTEVFSIILNNWLINTNLLFSLTVLMLVPVNDLKPVICNDSLASTSAISFVKRLF